MAMGMLPKSIQQNLSILESFMTSYIKAQLVVIDYAITAGPATVTVHISCYSLP